MNELRTKRIRDSPDFDNHIKRHRAKREGGREEERAEPKLPLPALPL